MDRATPSRKELFEAVHWINEVPRVDESDTFSRLIDVQRNWGRAIRSQQYNLLKIPISYKYIWNNIISVSWLNLRFRHDKRFKIENSDRRSNLRRKNLGRKIFINESLVRITNKILRWQFHWMIFKYPNLENWSFQCCKCMGFIKVRNSATK